MIAKRVQEVSPSGIREFFDLVLGMPEVISLGVGEPDFISPWRIREKAITALEEGMTSYTSNQGLFVLRRAISNHFKKQYSLEYSPEEEILVTAGVSEGLDLAIRAVTSPGDKIIVVCPYYVAYPALVQICCGEVLYLLTTKEDGFKIDLHQLKELLKHNPKAIILNYPSNPTGVTYSGEELKDIWELISQKDTVVISDEIYEELTYEGKHYPFAALSQKAKERTIFLNGFSKGYAMTGFRVGYACASQPIISAMNKIHSFSALCAGIVAQVAAVEALRLPREVEQMRQEYRRRRDFIVKELNRIGLDTVMPKGAFYCFPSIEKFPIKAMDFAKKLLYDQKVAVVPGTAFGSGFVSHIRISYANSLDNLKEAIARIEAMLKQL